MLMKLAFCIALAAAALPYGIDRLARVSFPPPKAKNSGIVVTGASTGIGRHAAEHMARRGFVVYAGYRKESDAASLREAGIPTLVPLKLDVTDEASVASAVEFVSSDLRERGNLGLAGLVNNAGVYLTGSVEFTDISGWKRLHEVNLYGVVRCTQAFLPLLRHAKGRIVQISSVSGLMGGAMNAPYASSKWALEATSHALRQELYSQGISVSVVNPGVVKSEMGGKTDFTMEPDEEKLYGMLSIEDFIESAMPKSDEAVVTSEAIDHALTDRYPRAQYVVANMDGTPAWVLTRMAWLLPTFAMDKLARSMMQTD